MAEIWGQRNKTFIKQLLCTRYVEQHRGGIGNCWSRLYVDVWRIILNMLSPEDRLMLRFTCRRFASLMKWRQKYYYEEDAEFFDVQHIIEERRNQRCGKVVRRMPTFEGLKKVPNKFHHKTQNESVEINLDKKYEKEKLHTHRANPNHKKTKWWKKQKDLLGDHSRCSVFEACWDCSTRLSDCCSVCGECLVVCECVDRFGDVDPHYYPNYYVYNPECWSSDDD